MSSVIVLPFGDSRVTARWGGACVRFASSRVTSARDPSGAVRRAVRHPIGCDALRVCARGVPSAVVVVSDHTRETGVRRVLPVVFDELRAAGVADDAVTVLVAYGNHAPVPDAVIRETTGPLPRGVRLVHHDSRDEGMLAGVGALAPGREFRVNRLAADAGMLVLTGSITFHYHAGYTGGRKAVLPGLASHADVLANHARTLSDAGGGAGGGRDPRCQPGRMDGNPVSAEMEAAARLLASHLPRSPFLVNTVLTEGGSIAAVFAGDLFEAHRAGAAWVDERFRVVVRRRFDVAFASAGGYPRDGTFYQAHKAYDHAARAVRDGGVVVLAAECRGGAGAGFLHWFDFPTYDEHLAALRGAFAVPGQTALALRQKNARVKGVLVSAMPGREVEKMGLVPARSLAEACGIARELLAANPRACAIPHASMVLPTDEG